MPSDQLENELEQMLFTVEFLRSSMLCLKFVCYDSGEIRLL
jgi:hypothetical protein